ncbi:cytochrome P450 CYP12A2-like [Anthonomus grandis grandis]|uniref:cytochrome P450 CYP12A2-like n=1 Tax=Anthonomus grandis grandis TaxID=2921223 RepID=UPI002165DBFA|nr:cytochrome P450 CYP12A2-like [Anthonomus grandis grandis]
MPQIKPQTLKTFMRLVSTNNPKQATAQAVSLDGRDSYYQKIGNKALDSKEDIKPEGWYDAIPFKRIPGPKPLPIIGNVWRFFPGGEYYNVQLIDLHKKLQQQYGKLAYLSGIPGKRPILFAYDPEDIEQTLRNEGPWPIRFGLPSFAYYRKYVRDDVFQGVGGVLTVQGEEWFQFRSIVNKILMQPRTAELYVYSMDDVANGLISNIRRFSKNNPRSEMPDDFQNELYKWALESMGVIAYNTRIGCLEPNLDKNSVGQRMIDSSVELFELMYQLDVLPSLWPVYSTKEWKRYVQILDYMTEVNQKYIEECLQNTNPDPNIPDHERSVLERLAKTNKKVAIAMATDMVIAGIDTTGRTMASALYFLARNPDKQELLREELRKYLPNKDSPVTKDILRGSPYLKAVIKETTRLSPVSIGTLRTTVKDMVLSGYQIPKGTDILATNIIPSMEEKHFKMANQFIPERWLRTTEGELSHKNVHQFVHLPFGFGPRSCIGKRLANLELEVGLSKIVRNFNLSWHHPDPKFGTKLLYGIMDPLRVKMEEIEN